MKHNRTLRPKFIQKDDEFRKNKKEGLYGREVLDEMSPESEETSHGGEDERVRKMDSDR